VGVQSPGSHRILCILTLGNRGRSLMVADVWRRTLKIHSADYSRCKTQWRSSCRVDRWIPVVLRGLSCGAPIPGPGGNRRLCLQCQTPSERTSGHVHFSDCPRTNGQTVQGRQYHKFTTLHVALNLHRMTHFLLRPNKSAQLLKIIVAPANNLTVSSSSSDVNSDILIN